MAALAVQYLEYSPQVASISPRAARARLRFAFDILPIDYVLLGWDLPPALSSACREETARAGAQLFRWQPLLTGDGVFAPRPEWQVIGLDGERVPGFRGLPEFTFVCPNRPAVRQDILAHLQDILKDGNYQGVFLDRMRFPSPTRDPVRKLACFCESCRRAAASDGIDLDEVVEAAKTLGSSLDGKQKVVQALLEPGLVPGHGRMAGQVITLVAFLRFRQRCITRFICELVDLVCSQGFGVGLDCFSPLLTHMVGQDLGALDALGDWTKVMTYGHALGPAGLPYELLELTKWLAEPPALTEQAAMTCLSAASHLPLPDRRKMLCEDGLSAQALAYEVRRGLSLGADQLLAGIELVEIEGIAQLNKTQIQADLVAMREAGAQGLVLSWDLWDIPQDRLEIVAQVWG